VEEGKKHKGRRQEVGKTRRRGERSSERERGGNRGGGRKTRGVSLRERLTGAAQRLQPRRLWLSGDLPSRAKPLINAFAKKLHAVGGKQEQEGVGRARSDTRETTALRRRLATSPRRFRPASRARSGTSCTSTFATVLLPCRGACEPPQPIRSRFWSR